MTTSPSEILVSETAFWVSSRGRRFGPFDYQWSADLHGLELTYCGQKYGEICSADEMFADLSPFRMPISICRVATITAATIVEGIGKGETMEQRCCRLFIALKRFGYGRFHVRDAAQDSASN